MKVQVRPSHVLRTAMLAVAVGCVAPCIARPAAAWEPEHRLSRSDHERLGPQWAASPFGRPLVVISDEAAGDPHGEVYAVIDHPFERVAAVLRRADQWCELLLLQANVKRCSAQGPASRQTVTLAVGRIFDQPADSGFELAFDFEVPVAADHHLLVQMAAQKGPLGTHDYRLRFEAIPLSSGRSFVHLTYAYANGLAARLATGAYLSTAGRNKVGFTVIGRDAAGQPVHVRGVRGIAERNAMRYYLAIEALLDSPQAVTEPVREDRMRRWFAATERHARQLHELSLDEYLGLKLGTYAR